MRAEARGAGPGASGQEVRERKAMPVPGIILPKKKTEPMGSVLPPEVSRDQPTVIFRGLAASLTLRRRVSTPSARSAEMPSRSTLSSMVKAL